MDCTIVGDSIAVGIANFRQECRVDARIGRRAEQQGPVGEAGRVLVISVGSNNRNSLDERELRRIRDSAIADHVFWIVPNTPEHARTLVQRVARIYNDQTLDVAPVVSHDKVHPTWRGYQILAFATRR